MIDKYDMKYRIEKAKDRFCLWLAIVMPARLRQWVVVDSTNEARKLYPHPTGYAGPDGLGYPEIYDGAVRSKHA